MKIVIAKALVQSLLGTSGAVAGQFAVLTREVEEEVGSKSTASKVSNIINKIPHFNDIQTKVSKIVSVNKTSDEVTIEISDEFIADIAELGATIVRKTMPLTVQYIKTAINLQHDVDAFEAKWKPEPKSAEDTPAA